MDLSGLLHVRETWSRFCGAHPQFPLFLQAVRSSNALAEGTVVEITVTPAGEQPIHSKTRISAEDAEGFRSIAQLIGR